MSDRRLSPSRRQLLALGAAGIGFGATGKYIVGADPLGGDESVCEPRERLFDPDDWSMPGYDPAGTGHAPARTAPTGSLHQQWHADFRGDRISQPLISAGRVVVATSGSHSGEQIRTYDLTAGEKQWTAIVSKNGIMGEVGDLVASGGDLFHRTQTDTHGMAVMSLSLGDGEQHWVAPSDGGVYGRPIVTERGRVWISDRDGNTDESPITSLSADTGGACSSWRIDGSGAGTVLMREDLISVGTAKGLFGLDRETGEEQWRAETGGSPSVITRDRVFATRHPGYLRAYSADSGDIDWTVESEHYADGELHPENDYFKIVEGGSSIARPNYRDLAVAGELLLARERVYSRHADRITVFDTATGDEMWQRDPPAAEADDRIWYTGPIVAGESAFVCENRREGDSSLLRIDVSSGETLDTVEMDAHAMAAPAVGRGAVVVPRRDGIACYADDRW